MAMRDNKAALAADAVLAMKCRRDNRVTFTSFISDESLCLDRSKLPCGYYVRKHPSSTVGTGFASRCTESHRILSEGQACRSAHRLERQLLKGSVRRVGNGD